MSWLINPLRIHCHVLAHWKINSLRKLCRVVLVCINSNVLIKVGPGKYTTVFCFYFHYTYKLCQQRAAKSWDGKTNQDYVRSRSSRISRNFSVGLCGINFISLCLPFFSVSPVYLTLKWRENLIGSVWVSCLPWNHWRRGLCRIKLHRPGPFKSSSECSRTSVLYF